MNGEFIPHKVNSILNSDDIDFVSEGLYDLHDYATEKKCLEKVEKCVKDALGKITPTVEAIEAINNVIPLGEYFQDNLAWRQTEQALSVFKSKISNDQSHADIVTTLISEWGTSEDEVVSQFEALWKTTNQIWHEDFSSTILMSLIDKGLYTFFTHLGIKHYYRLFPQNTRTEN